MTPIRMMADHSASQPPNPSLTRRISQSETQTAYTIGFVSTNHKSSCKIRTHSIQRTCQRSRQRGPATRLEGVSANQPSTQPHLVPKPTTRWEMTRQASFLKQAQAEREREGPKRMMGHTD